MHRAEFRDLLLPIAVVAVVGMLIFPVPAAVLDALLICNISIALVLLISSVYLAEPQRFTSLPTILLLTTMFRLGLNISTTRQILSGGSAPEIVVTFGNFVVGGNLVVGAVVFGIITLVQFLVIAKGSERVAEVAARFTLDAMPGKQMAIDADMRSGALSLAEARERRRELQTESRLYGALDGAMKFVKGDAIAGLLITVLNISAGLFVGISQQGLGLAEALERYTLFTVGDGLVSQIPALLVSVAAGIAVTRVEDSAGSLLGRDLFSQLSREPQALGATAAVLGALALVPGLPAAPCLGIAAILVVVGALARRSQNTARSEQGSVRFQPKVLTGIVLRVSVPAAARLQQERELPQMAEQLRARMFERWGILVPELQYDIEQAGATRAVSLLLHGEVIGETPVIDEASADAPSFSARVLRMVEHTLERRLAELVDDTQTRVLLEVHQPAAEDLINNVVPELVSVTALTSILRRLLAEKVSVRSMNLILQSVAEQRLCASGGGSGADSLSASCSAPPALKALAGSAPAGSLQFLELLAAVRTGLRRGISASLRDAENRIQARPLDPALDFHVAKAAVAGAALDPRLIRTLAEAARSIQADEGGAAPVLVASRWSRGLVWTLLRDELDEVHVLSPEEICDETILVIGPALTVRELEPPEDAAPEASAPEDSRQGASRQGASAAGVSTPLRRAA